MNDEDNGELLAQLERMTRAGSLRWSPQHRGSMTSLNSTFVYLNEVHHTFELEIQKTGGVFVYKISAISNDAIASALHRLREAIATRDDSEEILAGLLDYVRCH